MFAVANVQPLKMLRRGFQPLEINDFFQQFLICLNVLLEYM